MLDGEVIAFRCQYLSRHRYESTTQIIGLNSNQSVGGPYSKKNENIECLCVCVCIPNKCPL